MKSWIFFGALIALVAVDDWIDKCEIRRLESELETAQALAASWEQKARSAESDQGILREQAQACLDREASNQANSAIWLEIIEQSKTRDMEEGEKRGVPDDKTRRNLLDSLDEPL